MVTKQENSYEEDRHSEGHSQLKAMVEKIEALEEEKAEVGRLVRDAYTEARLAGFDPKIMRRVLRCRKMRKEQYLEEEQLLDTYLNAVGMRTKESGSSEASNMDSSATLMSKAS